MSPPDVRRADPKAGPTSTTVNAAAKQVRPNRTTDRRQKPATAHVVAEAIEVVGGTGRHRWVLIVRRCPGCNQSHICHGRGELPVVLQRNAACGAGRLALHPVGSEVTG